MVSEARTRVCSRLVMSRSRRSPALCPQVSFTTLNWSRSTYSSTNSPSPRCAAVTADSSRVSNSRRLMRPVSASWLAW